MSLKDDLKKAAQRSSGDLLFLVYTFFWLGLIRAAIGLFAFQRLCTWLGLRPYQKNEEKEQPANPVIERISWAVNAAAYRTPWESACLARALAGALLLRQKKIPSVLYLGVAKNENGTGISAHAWLRCGEKIITGESGHQRFNVIAVFSIQ